MMRLALLPTATSCLCLLGGCLKRGYHQGNTRPNSFSALPAVPERRSRVEAAMERRNVGSCDEETYPSEVLDATESENSKMAVTFAKAPLVPHPNPPPGSHPDLVNLPSGMEVIGNLDAARNTVVFIHGWSPCGQGAVFRYPSRWHRAGWNTAILRWHHGSFDPFSLPTHAEQSVWRSVGEFGAQEWRRLREALGPDYRGRVWLVTHSLGVSMSAYILQKFVDENSRLLPHRLDIIDPYTGFWRDFPADSPLFDRLNQPENMGSAMERVFTNLRYRANILTTFHSATIGWMSSSNIMSWHTRVIMDARWRSPGVAHQELLDMFMRSIDEDPGELSPGVQSREARRPPTANTPESDLRGRSSLEFQQVEGLQANRYADMLFESMPAAP